MTYADRDEYNAYHNVYGKSRYRRLRAEWIERLGGQCVSCGSSERLEFDHIDPTTKTGTIAMIWSASTDKIIAELAKCQLLCRPCHQLKTSAETRRRARADAAIAALYVDLGEVGA